MSVPPVRSQSAESRGRCPPSPDHSSETWHERFSRLGAARDYNGLVAMLRAEPPSPVLVEIADERRRQVEAEGWTPEHDDEHTRGELAMAAAAYAHWSARESRPVDALPFRFWPWDRRWWKPKDRRRDLIRAAALIVAEIERLDRRSALQACEGKSLPIKGSDDV